MLTVPCLGTIGKAATRACAMSSPFLLPTPSFVQILTWYRPSSLTLIPSTDVFNVMEGIRNACKYGERSNGLVNGTPSKAIGIAGDCVSAQVLSLTSISDLILISYSFCEATCSVQPLFEGSLPPLRRGRSSQPKVLLTSQVSLHGKSKAHY